MIFFLFFQHKEVAHFDFQGLSTLFLLSAIVHVACIFNESITLGTFPDKLKWARVIPVYKKGAHNEPSNYRPISLLSVFGKLFEKLMFKRLYEYLDNLNTFYPLQFGFRENTQLIMH